MSGCQVCQVCRVCRVCQACQGKLQLLHCSAGHHLNVLLVEGVRPRLVLAPQVHLADDLHIRRPEQLPSQGGGVCGGVGVGRRGELNLVVTQL